MIGMWFSGMAFKVLGVVGVGVIVFGLYHMKIRQAYNEGYNAAVEKVNQDNAAAERKARDAFEALRRECARDFDKCLRDGWTRDR